MEQELIRQTPLWAENWPIAYSVVQAIVILLVVVLVAALMSFIERRLLALWQDRGFGRYHAGPSGRADGRIDRAGRGREIQPVSLARRSACGAARPC